MASSQSPYAPMTTSRDTPNPLRPYYIPPSIGATPGQPANVSTASTTASKPGLGRSARDLLSELDYGGPLLDRDGPTVAEMGKKIVDQAIWKYTSVLLAQPFDIAKVILQVRLAAASGADADKKAHSRKSLSRDASRRRSEVCDGARMWASTLLRRDYSIQHPLRQSQKTMSRHTSRRRNHKGVDRGMQTSHPRDGEREGGRHLHRDRHLLHQSHNLTVKSSHYASLTRSWKCYRNYGSNLAQLGYGEQRMPHSFTTFCQKR